MDVKPSPSNPVTEIPIYTTTNTGSYSWKIPANVGGRVNLGGGNIYKIVVQIGRDAPVGTQLPSGQSASDFSIVAK